MFNVDNYYNAIKTVLNNKGLVYKEEKTESAFDDFGIQLCGKAFFDIRFSVFFDGRTMQDGGILSVDLGINQIEVSFGFKRACGLQYISNISLFCLMLNDALKPVEPYCAASIFSISQENGYLMPEFYSFVPYSLNDDLISNAFDMAIDAVLAYAILFEKSFIKINLGMSSPKGEFRRDTIYSDIFEAKKLIKNNNYHLQFYSL